MKEEWRGNYFGKAVKKMNRYSADSRKRLGIHTYQRCGGDT